MKKVLNGTNLGPYDMNEGEPYWTIIITICEVKILAAELCKFFSTHDITIITYPTCLFYFNLESFDIIKM